MCVGGITKYLESHKFVFDNTFGEAENPEDVYGSLCFKSFPHEPRRCYLFRLWANRLRIDFYHEGVTGLGSAEPVLICSKILTSVLLFYQLL